MFDVSAFKPTFPQFAEINVNHSFVKLPDLATAEITDRINRGVKIPRGKRLITYTSNTINVLRAIIKRLDRARNIAKISFEELKHLTGIRNRSTLADHLYLLESDMQFIDVKRGRSKGVKNTINIYRLIGHVADCVLDRKRAKTAKNADLQSPIIGQESESLVGCLLNKVTQETRDFGIAEPILLKLIEEFGHERVDAFVALAKKQTWAENPQGWAVKQIRDPKADPFKKAKSNSESPANQHSWGKYDANKPAAPAKQTWLNDGAHTMRNAKDEQQKAEIEASKPTAIENDGWRIAYNQLELQFDRFTFDTWIKGARLIAVEGNQYTVWHETVTKRDMCQHRLYRNIHRVLWDVIGSEDVVIQFVTTEDLAVA